jgi:preprotein translocase subunit YajC
MTPFFLTLLAQAADTKPPEGLLGNPMIMMVLMVVMFYFLLIRPSQKQRKEQAKRIAALQKGDEVITTSGKHAIVHNVKDRTVVLKVAEGVMEEYEKSAVATVNKKTTATAVEAK